MNRASPASQHRGQGDGDLPEDLQIGFSGKGSGIYAPFSSKPGQASYVGQRGELDAEQPAVLPQVPKKGIESLYCGSTAALLFDVCCLRH